jgi:hypothetical protein
MTSKLLFTVMICEKMAPPFVVVINMKDCGAPTVTHTNHSSKVMKESNPLATVSAPTHFASKTPHHCRCPKNSLCIENTTSLSVMVEWWWWQINDSESNHSTLKSAFSVYLWKNSICPSPASLSLRLACLWEGGQAPRFGELQSFMPGTLRKKSGIWHFRYSFFENANSQIPWPHRQNRDR